MRMRMRMNLGRLHCSYFAQMVLARRGYHQRFLSRMERPPTAFVIPIAIPPTARTPTAKPPTAKPPSAIPPQANAPKANPPVVTTPRLTPPTATTPRATAPTATTPVATPPTAIMPRACPTRSPCAASGPNAMAINGTPNKDDSVLYRVVILCLSFCVV